MKKLLLLAIVVLGISAVSFGQVFTNTATATATAKIFTALTVKKTGNLQFGALGAKTSPTIAVVSTGGSRSASTADVMGSGVGAAAVFEVTGDAGNPFTITFSVPAEGIKLIDLSDDLKPAMVINPGGFIAKIDDANDNNSGTIATGNKSIVRVGATLQVGANQPPGDYTGEFSVTVNYN